MGDRANIYIEMPTSYDSRTEPGGVYLYTHWMGSEWPEALRKALEFGRGRWSDESYLARIITSRVFADLVESETGGGLSLILTDNEYSIIVVDLIGQTVSFADAGDEKFKTKRYGTRSFEEFVAQKVATYANHE